jgi:hypothetical protein
MTEYVYEKLANWPQMHLSKMDMAESGVNLNVFIKGRAGRFLCEIRTASIPVGVP